MKILTDENNQPFGILYSLEEFNTRMVQHIEEHFVKPKQKPKRRKKPTDETAHP